MEIVDNVYIQPCTNELQGLGFSPENQEARLKDGHSRKVECSSKNMKNKEDTECSYDNKLIYQPYRFTETSCDNITLDMFWDDVATNVSNLIEQNNETHNIVILVSHHNRMKKTILKLNENNKNKINAYANSSAICLHSFEKGVSILTDGYPDNDKNKYVYANAQNINDDLLTKDTNIALNKFREKLKDRYVTVIVVRHGNALHNYPVNVRNILHQGPLDSSLTPLGCLQASITGFYISKWIDTYSKSNNFQKNKICLMSSYLNRAQHSVCLIGKLIAVKHKIKLQNIPWLEEEFTKEAYDKFLRNASTEGQKLMWAEYKLLLEQFESSNGLHLTFKAWDTKK
jgi:hypothetical protein